MEFINLVKSIDNTPYNQKVNHLGVVSQNLMV